MPATKVKLTGGSFQDSEGNLLEYGYLDMKLSADENVSGVGNIASGITVKILLDGNASVEGTTGLTLSAVATSVGGTAVYTGTISGGGNDAFVGLTFVVTGFTTSANNGTFVCTASTATTLTLDNTSAAAQTHSGTATATQSVWANSDMLPINSYYRVTGYTALGQPAWGPNNQQVSSGATFDVGTWIPNQVISWTPSVQSLELLTNSVDNSDQTKLNVEDTASVTWASTANGVLKATAVVPAGISLETNSVANSDQGTLNVEDTATVTWASTAGGVLKATASAPNPAGYNIFNNIHGWTVDCSTSTISQFGAGLTAPMIGTNLYVQSTAGHPAKFRDTSQAVPGGQATMMEAFATTPAINLNGLNFWKMRTALVTVGASDEWYCGMTNVNLAAAYIQTTPTTQNVCAFRYIGGATNWGACCCDSSGASTIVDTGIAYDVNMHTFLIVPNSNGSSIDFYIDGVLGATIATHVPTGNVGSNLSLKSNAHIIDFEYMWYGYTN